MDDIQTLLQAAQTMGLWLVFAWLYLDERKQHNRTRQDMSDRVRAAKDAHMADLREIAGMRVELNRVAALAQAQQAQQQAHK
jgi:2-iminoacetate synthase ThiH